MANAKDTESKKTMDVSRPGNSTPDTSSRPVLVTHKPQVEDPMVKKEQSSEQTPAPSHGNKVIQPISQQPEKEAPETPTEETPEEKEAKKEAAVVDAVADQADLGKKNVQEQLNEEAKKQQEALAKLTAEKKYFVPIGQVAHRRNQQTLLFFLVLLIALIGVYVAIDAEVLDINVELPFDLIKS